MQRACHFTYIVASKSVTMEMFRLDLVSLMIRFYLVMAVVIIAGFIGNWWLSLLAIPIFLSTLLAVKFSRNNKKI
jgi:hypothetical protein